MRRNKITSLLLATTLVLQPIMSTLVLQPTIAIAEEQGSTTENNKVISSYTDMLNKLVINDDGSLSFPYHYDESVLSEEFKYETSFNVRYTSILTDSNNLVTGVKLGANIIHTFDGLDASKVMLVPDFIKEDNFIGIVQTNENFWANTFSTTSPRAWSIDKHLGSFYANNVVRDKAIKPECKLDLIKGLGVSHLKKGEIRIQMQNTDGTPQYMTYTSGESRSSCKNLTNVAKMGITMKSGCGYDFKIYDKETDKVILYKNIFNDFKIEESEPTEADYKEIEFTTILDKLDEASCLSGDNLKLKIDEYITSVNNSKYMNDNEKAYMIEKGIQSVINKNEVTNCIILEKKTEVSRLVEKAEDTCLKSDIMIARKKLNKLPESLGDYKSQMAIRLNQVQMINIDSSILEAVKNLASSINETLASKNYTKDSLVKLKNEADDTQNNFENIIDPMIKSRAVSFMAMPYSNLCKTIDDMDMISSDDAINEAIKVADKDMTQLINIYVTIENMSKDDPNKSKYEELIKNKIEEVLKGSSDLKGDIDKIKQALNGNTISKEELENLIKDIKDETLKSQLEKDLGIESKPEIPTIDLEEITSAVVKAEQSKEQKDIDDALTKVNQMPNGVDKDKLLDRINNISKTETPTNPDSNSPLTVSKDLTVKTSSSNSLELLLDTNEVAFEDYNGAKDSEKLNAVTATVSSSLPFDLSVTQLNEIESSNGNKMEDTLLNFRETGKEYSSLGKGNKVTILQDHESGKNINTVFDIKLKGDSSVKKDNYSTTLRFEAMQK